MERAQGRSFAQGNENDVAASVDVVGVLGNSEPFTKLILSVAQSMEKLVVDFPNHTSHDLVATRTETK